MRGAGPTVAVPSLVHVAAGCGSRTRSAGFEDKRCLPWGCRVAGRIRLTDFFWAVGLDSNQHLDFAEALLVAQCQDERESRDVSDAVDGQQRLRLSILSLSHPLDLSVVLLDLQCHRRDHFGC